MFDFASYHRAATLADAINLLADNPQAKLLAGGTGRTDSAPPSQ
ncbi:xanthine dehydrogenase FAD-binding subunit [Escherichia coli]|uniref:Xanthine dehydrogenase FAD-binding subunit n=1 Tax=Escherichia coli TaxID=562 RepID=A0A376MIK9_ECOLX|nr:xanthine dehydrogenase FAD-binding subunit [Escherichia coli]